MTREEWKAGKEPCETCDDTDQCCLDCLAPEAFCECNVDTREIGACPDCTEMRLNSWLRHYHSTTPKHDFRSDAAMPDHCIVCGLFRDLHEFCDLTRKREPMNLRKASEVVGDMNSQGPLSHSASADHDTMGASGNLIILSEEGKVDLIKQARLRDAERIRQKQLHIELSKGNRDVARRLEALYERLSTGDTMPHSESIALSAAIDAFTHTELARCQECGAFTEEDFTEVDDRQFCPECVQSWQDEAASDRCADR